MPIDPGLALPTLSDQVRRLERAWEREYPKRAAGALDALSGFRYQFLVVLLETVRGWLALPRPEQARLNRFTERLSDLLAIEGERAVTVTQIKKTASTPQVKASLEELWRIHSLAVTETPELACVMRYRILAANGTLAAIERVRDEWTFEGATSTELTEFKYRVEAVIETDPEDELLALLVNELRAGDPLGSVYGWYGKLLDAAEHGSFEGAAKTVWDDLIGLAAADDKPAGIFIWTSEDRPPREVKKGGFLSGRQPLVKDLKDGNFAPRRKAYVELNAQAALWIESDPTALDQGLRVPVFWIEGRSGSGKSVALLHLLAQLHDEGYGPIVWLADKILSLPETMRWARRLQQKGRRVIIGLDDPFAPGEQTDSARVWREALAVIQDAREGNRPEEMPLILCCGPTEQADNLAAELSQDLLIKRYELPHESREELAELRKWFLLRTGNNAPEIGDDNVLLVQVFFEWRVRKTLPAFADHFRARLRAADSTGAILGFVTRLLSLNRIYVGYPPAASDKALTGKQRDALNGLRRQEHIADDRHGRRGLWLAHPHLSNALYEHWYPSSGATREERKEHLLAAIGACLTYGESPRDRMAPLWALTHTLKGTAHAETLAERIEPELVSDLLVKIYTQLLRPADLHLSELPVWIELQGLHPDLALEPDPVLLAVDAVHIKNLDQTGLRLTCHKLLQYRNHFPEPLRTQSNDAIVRLLTDSLSLSWKEWQPVALDAVVRLRDTRLWPLVRSWSKLHPWSREAANLLSRALSASDGDPELLQTSHELLQGAPADIAWGDLAILLLDLNLESVPPAVEQWALVRKREFSACFVLHKLLERGLSAAKGWAMEWAEIWHRERSANFVLESLCRHGVATPMLRDWSCTWISLGKANGGFLLERLFERFPEDVQVSHFAHQWLLRTSPGNASWGLVWSARHKKDPSDLRLEQVARKWLSDAPPEHYSWTFVWQELWNAAPADPDLRELAKDWLQTVSTKHGSWKFVWKTLWKANPTEPSLEKLARDWLRNAPPEDASWALVWKPLWRATPADPDLQRLAEDWLQTVPASHGLWKFVWRILWQANPSDPDLQKLAKDWLQAVPASHDSWKFVWRILWKADPSDPDLQKLGNDWLRKAPAKHGSWAFVWEILSAAAPTDPDLLQLAKDWLDKAPAEHGSWSFVWVSLWSKNPNDLDLETLGRYWLRVTPLDNPSWVFVWKYLLSQDPGDHELIEPALEWLRGASLGHLSWRHIWRGLWTSRLGDRELSDLACGWLRDIASQGRDSWGFVWEEIWKITPGDAELEVLGNHWLRILPTLVRSWACVWRPLAESYPEDSDLTGLARNWLSQATGHAAWTEVWTILWGRSPGDEELFRLAQLWLQSTPAEHESRVLVVESLSA